MKQLIVGALILLSPMSARSQETPCVQLHPLRGAFEYKDRGNRCEGLYVANVGAKELKLVSLTQGALTYELKFGAVLRVSTPARTTRVHIRAVSKIPNTYYQMDALLPAGSYLDWPVNDVLLPQGLDADKIGVFAWKGDENDIIVLPVQVTSVGPHPTDTRKIYLSIRPTFDVEKIEWRTATVNGGHCSAFGEWKHAMRDQILGGQTVDIALDGPMGQICIEVAAEAETSNDWITLPLRLELAAQ